MLSPAMRLSPRGPSKSPRASSAVRRSLDYSDDASAAVRMTYCSPASSGIMECPAAPNATKDLKRSLDRLEECIDDQIATIRCQLMKQIRQERQFLVFLVNSSIEQAAAARVSANNTPMVSFDPKSFKEDVDKESTQETEESNSVEGNSRSDNGKDLDVRAEWEHNNSNDFVMQTGRTLTQKMSKRMSDLYMNQEELDRLERPTTLTGKLVKDWRFESVCSTIILLNCVVMGLESHQEATGEISEGIMQAINTAEQFFTGFFLAECLLRFHVVGWKGYIPITAEGRSNLVDAILVLVAGVLITWVIPLWTLISGKEFNQGALQALSVLRAVRLARLVRVFREVPLFREAWMLIRGLGDSSRTLVWTVVVILFVTYAFAILGLALIVGPLQSISEGLTGEELTRATAVLNYYDGVDKFMFTLVQVLTLDSFHVFVRETVHFVPYAWVFFYAYIAVAVFVLMNLVTAIIVENAMEQSKQDHDHQLRDKIKKQKQELKQLQGLFKAMDADKSGSVSWVEFQQSFEDPSIRNKWRLLDFQPEDCKELFMLLDTGDGEIETEEFFEGLSKMKGSAQAKDVYRLQRTLNRLLETTTTILDQGNEPERELLV